MLEESMEGGGGGNCDYPSPLLNEDSLIQILLWLPVISLLRFKSVCKSWRAIIENPFFIHTHANFPSKDTTTIKLGTPLFFRYSFWGSRGNIFTVSGDEFKVFEDLGTPPYYRDSHYKDITMAGCCNGIICLHDTDYLKSYIYSTISLWNPAIKQFRFLPIPFSLEGIEDEDVVEHYVGFGFDVKTKEYKVLLITYEGKNKDDVDRIYSYASGVQVYSLSSDSWRCIDANTLSDAQPNLTRNWRYCRKGHYLNGSYLFIAGYLYEGEFQEATNSTRQECFKHVIISFDFTEEIFRTVQLPFDVNNEMDNSADIIFLGEKIAVMNAYCAGDGSPYCNCLEFWVLNEYGGNESWSKFYTFVSPTLPKFITDNGEFILLDCGQDVEKLQLLNVVTEEIKDLQCDDWEGPSQGNNGIITRVGVYKPSLVPIAGNGAKEKKETERDVQVQLSLSLLRRQRQRELTFFNKICKIK